MTLHGEETSVKSVTGPISELRDLESASDDDLSVFFIANGVNIYLSPRNDVLAALEPRDINVLMTLRNELYSEFHEKFPAYIDRTLINRKVKNTLLSDIYLLGFSVVNTTVHKDIEKVFVSKTITPSATNLNVGSLPHSSETDPDEEISPDIELARMIQIVLQLRTKVAKLEENVTALQQRNLCAPPVDTHPQPIAAGNTNPQPPAAVPTDPQSAAMVNTDPPACLRG